MPDGLLTGMFNLTFDISRERNFNWLLNRVLNISEMVPVPIRYVNLFRAYILMED